MAKSTSCLRVCFLFSLTMAAAKIFGTFFRYSSLKRRYSPGALSPCHLPARFRSKREIEESLTASEADPILAECVPEIDDKSTSNFSS